MFETNPTPREAKISSIQPFDIATRRVSSHAFKTVGTAKKCAKHFQKCLRPENDKFSTEIIYNLNIKYFLQSFVTYEMSYMPESQIKSSGSATARADRKRSSTAAAFTTPLLVNKKVRSNMTLIPPPKLGPKVVPADDMPSHDQERT